MAFSAEAAMIQVKVETIRVRLTGHERLILLKELNQDRQLPIYIGVPEAEAIQIALKGYRHSRPLTHDLLTNIISALGGELQYVLVKELKEDIFFAVLHIALNGREIDIDARSSDSIAIAVRAQVPIYVAEEVMEKAGTWPSEDILDREQLSIFRDFVDTLNLGDLGQAVDNKDVDDSGEA
jgi:bifunctional DNase/RNase